MIQLVVKDENGTVVDIIEDAWTKGGNMPKFIVDNIARCIKKGQTVLVVQVSSAV